VRERSCASLDVVRVSSTSSPRAADIASWRDLDETIPTLEIDLVARVAHAARIRRCAQSP